MSWGLGARGAWSGDRESNNNQLASNGGGGQGREWRGEAK